MSGDVGTEVAAVVAEWDFAHSKAPLKTYVGDRWRYECRCGETFLTMQAFYAHRMAEGADALAPLIAERVEAAKAEALRVVESLHSEIPFQDFDIDRLRATLDPHTNPYSTDHKD